MATNKDIFHRAGEALYLIENGDIAEGSTHYVQQRARAAAKALRDLRLAASIEVLEDDLSARTDP